MIRCSCRAARSGTQLATLSFELAPSGENAMQADVAFMARVFEERSIG